MVEADSINSFKSRLDKHWANQDVVFNYNSELLELEVFQFVCYVMKLWRVNGM